MFFNKIQKRVYVSFDNLPGLDQWPKNLPIPKIGEFVAFDIWKQGRVLDVRHVLENKEYTLTIRIGDAK